MRTRYTTWEWDEYNGWTLYLGSNSWAMADQVTRALRAYDPQHYFNTYGSYEVSVAYEIIGSWQGRYYSWGYVPNVDRTVEILYALSKAIRPDVVINARDWSTQRISMEPWNAMPYAWRSELLYRQRAAGIGV